MSQQGKVPKGPRRWNAPRPHSQCLVSEQLQKSLREKNFLCVQSLFGILGPLDALQAPGPRPPGLRSGLGLLAALAVRGGCSSPRFARGCRSVGSPTCLLGPLLPEIWFSCSLVPVASLLCRLLTLSRVTNLVRSPGRK